MTDDPTPEETKSKERRAAPRARTFLKGVVYYDNRSASVDCTIRDLSETGARVTFTTMVTVPDDIELHIPQRQRSIPARVLRREAFEIGVVFADQRSDEPRRASDGKIEDRILKLENELVAVRRFLKKIEGKLFPGDGNSI